MTKLLLRLFVKDADNTDSPKVRAAIGTLSGLVGIWATISENRSLRNGWI